MNYYCLPYYGDTYPESLIGTVGLQDDTGLKIYLIGSHLSSAPSSSFLRVFEAFAYGLSFLQKLG